jgi:peptide methionine sulfoxide reductase MsrB
MTALRLMTTALMLTLSPSSALGLSNQQTNRRSFILEGLVSGATLAGLFSGDKANAAVTPGGRIQYGKDEDIMYQKAHGTSNAPVQSDLLYGVSNKLADKICNYNRHFAEMGGYFQSTEFETIVRNNGNDPVTFYDSVTGKPLFVAPINRSVDDFIEESKVHGWPSFRDNEVVWENVRVLKGSGETVSLDGTHLGHNLPDRSGNRYCINLVSVAGKPTIV